MNRSPVTLLVMAIYLMGCVSAKDTIYDKSDIGVVDIARSYIGTPYRYAGQSAFGMDCSGLTSKVYEQEISMARTAAGQAQQGRRVKMDDAKVGDLVFFKHKGKIFHVGIISSVNRRQLWMIHSSSSKGVVEQEILSNSYWAPKLNIIRRLR